MRRAAILAASLVGVLGLLVAASSCLGIQHSIVTWMTPEYEPPKSEVGFAPKYIGNDEERERIEINLVPVAERVIQATDLQFVPGDPKLVIALEKAGKALWFDLEDGQQGLLFEVTVVDDSEQGLLGLEFHPEFEKNGRIFVNTTEDLTDGHSTVVSEWAVPAGSDLRKAKPNRVKNLLEVPQPYPNHNAGQLAFGPDAKLYVGLGDGGWRDDPKNNAQRPETLLGSMLRIDVDDVPAGQGYGVPSDNPWVGKEGFRPEAWAIGLRNPWRYCFGPKGQLIVADVGQDAFEEVTLLFAGANAGWKVREAAHCFPEDVTECDVTGMTEPIYEYGRSEGGSITGGYVASGGHVSELDGKYVFADFLTGAFWAIDVPDVATEKPPKSKVWSLGKWPMLPSTFGQDSEGRVYVAGYRSGKIYRVEAK